MRKKLLPNEIFGVIFTLAGYVFMKNLYELTGRGLEGALFGCVNNSVWENIKALVLPFTVGAIIESLCIGAEFHRLVSAKVISLYFLSALYAGFGYLLLKLEQFGGNTPYILAAIAVLCAYLLSFALMKSPLMIQKFFPVALFLLFLIMSFYFCFTPFPPENELFRDPSTGLYGIIPRGYDCGANALDAIYGV